MSATINYLDELLDPVAECFTPDVARKIADLRANDRLQSRIDELAGKANEGTLSPEEREEYRTYVEAIELVSILQAKARATLQAQAARSG